MLERVTASKPHRILGNGGVYSEKRRRVKENQPKTKKAPMAL
jgi:hypothetical protein